MSRTLLKMFDETWAGKHDDFVVQFTCMNNTSFVLNHHHKNDISSQFAISLGEYEGGLLMVRNEMTNEYIHLNNNRKMVQFDGRKDHLVTSARFAATICALPVPIHSLEVLCYCQ